MPQASSLTKLSEKPCCCVLTVVCSAGILGMIGASLMLCRCHRSFNMKLAVVVTVSASSLNLSLALL